MKLDELIDSLLLASEAAAMTGHPTWAMLMGNAAQNLKMAAYCEDAQGDYIQELLKEREWIPVTERLPEPKEKWQRRVDVIAAYDTGCVTEVTYEFYDWTHYGVGFQTDMAEHITHWMELPKPPKEVSE